MNRTEDKHYTVRAAQDLLVRLVDVAEAEEAEGAGGEGIETPSAAQMKAYVRRARATFIALLTFPLGDVEIASDILVELERLPADTIHWLVQHMRQVLRETQKAGSFKRQAWVLRHIRLSVVFNFDGEYRFELGKFDAFDEAVGREALIMRGAYLHLQTLRLLHAVGIDRLLTCQCGRVFAKRGRREFCSSRCRGRVYMRAYRAPEKPEGSSIHGKTTRTR